MDPELVLESLRAVEPWDDADLAERLRVAEQQADLLRDLFRVKTEAFPMDAIWRLPQLTIERLPAHAHRPAVRHDDHRWIIAIQGTQTQGQEAAALLRAIKLIVDTPTFGAPDQRPRQAHMVAAHFAACVLMPTALLRRALREGATIEAIAQRLNLDPGQIRHRLRERYFPLSLIPHQHQPANAITQEGRPS